MLENYRVQVFRAVAEQASFRRAAEQLHISQPSVSQHVQLLEEELGVRLLDRGSAGIRMTAAGELLLNFARRSSRMSQQMLAALAKLEGEPGGALTLAASTTVAQYLLPRILGSFLKSNPRIQLAVRGGNTEQVSAWVLGGDAEMGLIEGPPAHKELAVEHFLDDRLLLIVPRGHAWAGRTEPLAALTTEPLLMREHGSGTRRVTEQALRKAGLRLGQLKISMELDSTEAIVSGVEAGLGVGFVSEWAIRKELRLGTLMVAQIAGVEIRRAFSLIRPTGPVAAGAVAAFRGFALSYASAEASRKSGSGPSSR
ncbi:MAG TPA: LysR family transcriptional regulator [Acidobacteriaceae bacterium]|jgi:DNA-binding transcriptional LysR family regulator|nr:LysR family transcriptional regulator [Acidobacteriaceae bacterium]